MSVGASGGGGARFITLEGIEGAGKSTLAQALAATLQARAVPVLLTREPGGTPLAERLRAIVLERGSEPISAEAETLLMFAGRSLHLHNRIRPALAAGTWVICDRFTDATRAYQGAGRGVDAALIERLAQAVHADLWPHRTLLLDVTVEQGLARARARRGDGDRFEDESRRFFESVRARYLQIADAERHRVHRIDAAASPAAVLASALQSLAPWLPPERP